MYERPLFTAKDSWEVGAQIIAEAAWMQKARS